MSEVLVPLLEEPGVKKAPAGRLPSKADFLCLLWGAVGGNFVGFQGKIYLNQKVNLILLCTSQELGASAAIS